MATPRRGMPRLSPRHSAATIRAGGGSLRSIAFAFGANVVIAAAKLVAGLLTGSSALLAEAVHSAADSINESLLWFSLRRARRPADAVHPFGYGGTRFLWAFLAAISSFLIGGGVSIALAIRELLNGSGVERFLIAWIVLGVAFVADGSSLMQTLKQARQEAANWGQSTLSYLRYTSDPTLRALAFEDGAALAGLILAGGGLLVHQLGGPASSDPIASLLIGILLAFTAIALARPLADLLIGRSMAPARLNRAYAIVAESPGIDEVLAIYGVHVAPLEVILAAKVHPSSGQTAEDLARRLDELDARLREELPEIAEVFIDATTHRLPSGTG